MASRSCAPAQARWGVHGARDSDTQAGPSETQLVFEVQNADDAARSLDAVGLDTAVWDESYGKHASVRDPFGAGIWLDEAQTDLYGYRPHRAEPASDIFVTAVRCSPDFTADQAFFSHLGYDIVGEQNPDWVPLRSSDGAVIGLHSPGDRLVTRPLPGSPIGGVAVCGLGFATTSPLEIVRDRLVAAGHPAELARQEHPGLVRVIDPDGCRIEIHPAP